MQHYYYTDSASRGWKWLNNSRSLDLLHHHLAPSRVGFSGEGDRDMRWLKLSCRRQRCCCCCWEHYVQKRCIMFTEVCVLSQARGMCRYTLSSSSHCPANTHTHNITIASLSLYVYLLAKDKEGREGPFFPLPTLLLLPRKGSIT